MSYAQTVTKMSLARWAQLMGLNPLHFQQVGLPESGSQPYQVVCDDGWFQHDWQANDKVGREQLAQAIATAEADVESWLGWNLAPSWSADERVVIDRPNDPTLVNYNGRDVRGLRMTLQTQAHFIGGGVRASTLMSAIVPIVWSDADLDGYFETGTVGPFATGVTAVDEVHVYYPGKSGAEEWEIRPARVTISGGNVTIVFRRELAVREALREEYTPEIVDGTVNGNFLTTVDVYRVYNDPSQMVYFLWEPDGGCYDCDGAGCANCAFGTQTGCLLERNRRLGIVTFAPATWDADLVGYDFSCCWSRTPDQARLWYRSGRNLLNWQQLAPGTLTVNDRRDAVYMERLVAQIATARLDRPACSCIGEKFADLQRDLAFEQGATQKASFRTNFADLSNPLGTRWGEMDGWFKLIQRLDLKVDRAGVKVR